MRYKTNRTIEERLADYMISNPGWNDLHVIAKAVNLTSRNVGNKFRTFNEVERREVENRNIQYRWIQ